MFALNNWKSSVRLVKRSNIILQDLLKSDKPYLQLRKNWNEKFNALTFEDMMCLIRETNSVDISSHEVADIFERWGYNFEAVAVDITRLIRDKQAALESK